MTEAINNIDRLILGRSERQFSTTWRKTEYGDDFDIFVSVNLVIHPPSKPYGGWPGTSITIRIWSICPPGQARFRQATKEEMIHFEGLLGELHTVNFTTHSTLGLVVVGK